MEPISSSQPPSSRRRWTALFLAIAIGGSYAIGAVWILRPSWGWLSQFLMWTPGIAALVVQGLRGEPPRIMGFRPGSWRVWGVALIYPFGVIAACIGLGYVLRFLTGIPIIHFNPEAAHGTIFGAAVTGLKIVPLRLMRMLVILLPWALLAFAYEHQLPEKLGRGRHLARGALWGLVFAFYPGPWWLPPGCIGEELGWRGWLVRTWRDRPLVALTISACAWTAFHLPVIGLEPELHAWAPALSFLLSIAAGAAMFQWLYLRTGSIWPPAIAHLTWNSWNPFFLGSQYGQGAGLFGGYQWVINGEGLLGTIVNGVVTWMLVRLWWGASAARSTSENVAITPGELR